MNKKCVFLGIFSIMIFALLPLPSYGMKRDSEDFGHSSTNQDNRNKPAPKKPRTDSNDSQNPDYSTLKCKIKITLINTSPKQTSDSDFQTHPQNRLKLNFDPVNELIPFLNGKYNKEFDGKLDTESPDYLRYGSAIVNYLTANNKKLVVIKLHHLPGRGEDEYRDCCAADKLLTKYELLPNELKIAKMSKGVKLKEEVTSENEGVLQEVHKNTKDRSNTTKLKDPFIILFEAAPGEDIYTILNNNKINPNTENIKNAFQSVAEYLAKLHAKTMKGNEEEQLVKQEESSVEQKKTDSSLAQHMTDTRAAVLIEEEENREEFEKILEKERDNFKERLQKSRRALAHNDCHTGNICYNATNSETEENRQTLHQSVTLIDYSGMEESFDFPHDIGKFIASLWQWYARTYTEAHVKKSAHLLMKQITDWQEIILEKYIASLKDEKVDMTDQNEIDLKEDIKYYKYAQIKKFLNNPKNKDEKEMKNNLLYFCLKEKEITSQSNGNEADRSPDTNEETQAQPNHTPEAALIEDYHQVSNQPGGFLSNMRRIPFVFVDTLMNLLSPLEEKSRSTQELKKSEEEESKKSGSEESAMMWIEPVLMPENPTETKEKTVDIGSSLPSDQKNVDIITTTPFQFEVQTPQGQMKAKYARSAAWNVFWPLTNETEGPVKKQLQKAQKKLNKTLISTGKDFNCSKNEYSVCLENLWQSMGNNAAEEKTVIEEHLNIINSKISYDAFYNSVFQLRAGLLKQYYDNDNQGKQCEYCENASGVLIKKFLGDRMGECWVCGFEDYDI